MRLNTWQLHCVQCCSQAAKLQRANVRVGNLFIEQMLHGALSRHNPWHLAQQHVDISQIRMHWAKSMKQQHLQHGCTASHDKLQAAESTNWISNLPVGP